LPARKHTTARFLKFRPRTRAILVLIGATFVIVARLTPWYVSVIWVNTGSHATAGHWHLRRRRYGATLLRCENG
jgi:hypothetical protein